MPKGRASAGFEWTRGAKTSAKIKGAPKLEEVPETEEGPDAPPARKKPRKSDDEEEEEEEQGPLQRGRSRRVVKEVEEEESTPPASKTRRSAAKPPSSKTTKTAGSSRRVPRLESDIEEEPKHEDEEAVITIEDDEDTLPVQTGRSRKAAAGKPASKQSQSKPSSNSPKKLFYSEDEEEDNVSTARPRKSVLATPQKDPTPEQQVAAAEEEDGFDGFDQQYKATPRRTERQDPNKIFSPAQSSGTPKLAPPMEDEEEQSLLEPRVRSQPQPQPSPVEEGPKCRLVIHKMVLVNFKSYAGGQEIGPFHKSFSSIVGPNGSGKSNTTDALLFVFGYRASGLRQGKLSELIHNSARYSHLDECRVEVHFREIIDLPGPDAYKVVPKSQLMVGRIAYKNNASKHTINGCASNFTEVQTLLKGRGIDLDHKRFLILQAIHGQ
ncbi:hypothetical protein JVU11DRAFT_6619 [Chiua virens]|nr:hypothetical protein JVU11DRAFT_6619 [Chiua virens]